MDLDPGEGKKRLARSRNGKREGKIPGSSAKARLKGSYSVMHERQANSDERKRRQREACRTAREAKADNRRARARAKRAEGLKPAEITPELMKVLNAEGNEHGMD